jgi:hypothetical protein
MQDDAAPTTADDDRLRLIALDAEDLAVLSAHVQDAVLKVGQMRWMPRERRFVIGLNRFAWEAMPEGNVAAKAISVAAPPCISSAWKASALRE